MEIRQQELAAATAQKVELLQKISGYSADEAKAELVEAMKGEAKSKAQAYVTNVMDEAKLNAKTKLVRLLFRPSKELVQSRRLKTLFLYSILNPMKLKVELSGVKDVISELWKLLQE